MENDPQLGGTVGSEGLRMEMVEPVGVGLVIFFGGGLENFDRSMQKRE